MHRKTSFDIAPHATQPAVYIKVRCFCSCWEQTMTIHIKHNINISSCDGRFFSYNIWCALEFIKSLLQSKTNIYCITRNCIWTKPNITTIPIYSVLDITAGYRILIYVFVLQHIRWVVRRWGVCHRHDRQPPPLVVSSWCYHFDITETFWNKKPKGMSGVVCVSPVHKTSPAFSLM